MSRQRPARGATRPALEHGCLAAGLLLAVLAAACGEAAERAPPLPPPQATYRYDDLLTLAHVQLEGTHNSYHVPREDNTAAAWSARQAPLGVQLAEQGVRAVELDLNLAADPGHFEVFHLRGLDEETTCRAFTDCLAALRAFSGDHPLHQPILVQLEPKEGFDPAAAEGYFTKLEAELLGVLPRDRLVTPDDVQGDAATLAEAVATTGWPTLGATRGKFLFFFDDHAQVREAYTRGGQSLAGRLLFTDSSPADPYGAVAVLNDPVANGPAIADALAAGFLVRTRADSDSVEPLAGDTTRLDAALASGAQIVSTDYPAPVPGLAYYLELPGGTPSRCNPVTAPSECSSLAIEDPALLEPPATP